MIKKIFQSFPLANSILAALTFLLGLGFAQYLGITLNLPAAWIGFVFILSSLFANSLLLFYFGKEPLNENETLQSRDKQRRIFLNLSLGLLTFSALLLVVLYFVFQIPTTSFFLGALIVISLLTHAIPPVRLIEKGIGEFVLAFVLASLTPIFSFLLNTPEPHRLLIFLTFPLVALAFSYLIVLALSTYANDLKNERRNLLAFLSWQNAITLHNGLIVVAFLGFLTARVFGLAFRIILPTFLTLPFAIYQIISLVNLSNGAKPNWRILKLNAATIFGVAAYLLAVTFWLS